MVRLVSDLKRDLLYIYNKMYIIIGILVVYYYIVDKILLRLIIPPDIYGDDIYDTIPYFANNNGKERAEIYFIGNGENASEIYKSWDDNTNNSTRYVINYGNRNRNLADIIARAIESLREILAIQEHKEYYIYARSIGHYILLSAINRNSENLNRVKEINIIAGYTNIHDIVGLYSPLLYLLGIWRMDIISLYHGLRLENIRMKYHIGMNDKLIQPKSQINLINQIKDDGIIKNVEILTYNRGHNDLEIQG